MSRPTVPAILQFGATINPASEIGQFGGFATTPYGNGLTLLMSGTAWSRGWYAETINTNRPFIQDFNAMDYVLNSYLFYLMTLGVPEYIAAMTYWANSIIQVAGQFYISLIDNNTGNTPASSPTQWQSGIPGMEVSGVVKAYAGVTAPAGYLICDGSAISRTTYASLFAVCGTNFGVGDGSTTFNIPDLRTRIPVGFLSADPNFGTIGGVGGNETETISIANLPNSSLSGTAFYGNGAGDVGVQGTNNGANPGAFSVAIGGSGTPISIIQPYLTMNYIIKT